MIWVVALKLFLADMPPQGGSVTVKQWLGTERPCSVPAYGQASGATAIASESSSSRPSGSISASLSYRDVEDMLAERGIDVSYETVRRWALKFGATIARK